MEPFVVPDVERKMAVRLYVACLVLLTASGFVQAQTSTGGTSTSSGLNYLIYQPVNHGEALPLLVFLHGIGEKGSSLDAVKRHGPPKMIENGTWPAHLPFIVVSPQLPARYSNWPPEKVDQLISDIVEKYAVAEEKIYLTGISLGGIGSWRYALTHPQRLAAVLPVCGFGNPEKACDMEKLPVWAFHGEKDPVVKPGGSIKMVTALRACPGSDTSRVKLTLYPDTGHDSWTRTYENPAIYRWLLSFTRRDITNTDRVKEVQKEPGNAFQTICDLPASLKETSGLVADARYNLWSHNDSGNAPALIKFDTTGKVLTWKRITNAANFDWEDLARDERGNFYIGDFGNNRNNRKQLQIYKIPHPDSIPGERVPAEVIQFSFPDQKQFPAADAKKNYDVEAMISFDGHLYIFTKNRTVPFNGYTKMYRIPNIPGEYAAHLIDSVKLGNGNMVESWITAAAISPDKSRIVLLSYNRFWLIDSFTGDKFFSGRITPVELPHFTQKEAVSFIDNQTMLITDEALKDIVGGKLYRVNLEKYLGTDAAK